MQVNTNNIQRPTLMEPFFNKELTPDNEFLTYIDCNTNSSNIVHKKCSVTSDSHNSKKSIINDFRNINNPLLDNTCTLLYSAMDSSYQVVHFKNSSIMFFKPDSDVINNLKRDDDFSIFETPQLHNCIQSLV